VQTGAASSIGWCKAFQPHNGKTGENAPINGPDSCPEKQNNPDLQGLSAGLQLSQTCFD
jgi:hypothetical protein